MLSEGEKLQGLMLAAEVAFVAISQIWPPLSLTARTREAMRYLGALVVM